MQRGKQLGVLLKLLNHQTVDHQVGAGTDQCAGSSQDREIAQRNQQARGRYFMPFAPVILEEYLEDYFENI